MSNKKDEEEDRLKNRGKTSVDDYVGLANHNNDDELTKSWFFSVHATWA